MNGIPNQGFEGKQTGKIRFTNRQTRKGNLSQKLDSFPTHYVFFCVCVLYVNFVFSLLVLNVGLIKT